HVLAGHANRLDEFDAGDGRGSCSIAHDLRGLDVALGQMEGIDEAGGCNDGGTVLVVMENRNIHELTELLFDDETVGRLDVLKVDAAERGPEIAHGGDELIDILGVDFEIDGIDIGEVLEEDGLALLDGLRR